MFCTGVTGRIAYGDIWMGSKPLSDAGDDDSTSIEEIPLPPQTLGDLLVGRQTRLGSAHKSTV